MHMVHLNYCVVGTSQAGPLQAVRSQVFAMFTPQCPAFTLQVVSRTAQLALAKLQWALSFSAKLALSAQLVY